jgi:hypothetical protein
VLSAAEPRRTLRCPAAFSLGKSRGGLGSPQLPLLGDMARGRFRCAEPVSCASRRPGFECGWRRTDGRLTGRGCVTAPQSVRRPSAIPLVAVARLPRPCPGLAAPCWRVSACLLWAAWGVHVRHNVFSGFRIPLSLSPFSGRDAIPSPELPGNLRHAVPGISPGDSPHYPFFPAGFSGPSLRSGAPPGRGVFLGCGEFVGFGGPCYPGFRIDTYSLLHSLAQP